MVIARGREFGWFRWSSSSDAGVLNLVCDLLGEDREESIAMLLALINFGRVVVTVCYFSRTLNPVKKVSYGKIVCSLLCPSSCKCKSVSPRPAPRQPNFAAPPRARMSAHLAFFSRSGTMTLRSVSL